MKIITPKYASLLTLLKYALSGSVALGIDIAILYLLRGANVPNVVAVCISASSATFVHYLISRYFVFRSFRRSFWAGLIYFISIVGTSLILNIVLYLFLSSIEPDHFIVDRITSVALIGLLSFLLNARYTFNVPL
jgi:putative flippase GtrA